MGDDYSAADVSLACPASAVLMNLPSSVIVIYIVILSYKTYRVYKGKEDFWLFRKTTRINGEWEHTHVGRTALSPAQRILHLA